MLKSHIHSDLANKKKRWGLGSIFQKVSALCQTLLVIIKMEIRVFFFYNSLPSKVLEIKILYLIKWWKNHYKIIQRNTLRTNSIDRLKIYFLNGLECSLKLLLMVSFHIENLLHRFYCFEKRWWNVFLLCMDYYVFLYILTYIAKFLLLWIFQHKGGLDWMDVFMDA